MKATLQSCSFVQLFGIRFVYLCWFLQSWPCLWLSGWLWTWTLGTFLCLPFLDTSLTLRKSSAGYLRSFSICRTTWCSIFFFWFPNTCGSLGIIIVIIQENKAGHRFTGKMPCERQRCFNWHCGKRDQRKFCQPRIATIAAIEIEHVGDTLKVKNILEKLRAWKNSLHYISQTTSQQWSKSNFIRSYDWKCMNGLLKLHFSSNGTNSNKTHIYHMYESETKCSRRLRKSCKLQFTKSGKCRIFSKRRPGKYQEFSDSIQQHVVYFTFFWMLPPACLMRSLDRKCLTLPSTSFQLQTGQEGTP